MPDISYTFRGMNNVDDPLDVGAPVPRIRQLRFTEAVSIVNADPDNDGRVALRPGYVKRYSGDILSAWANDEYILFHEGILLKRLSLIPGATTHSLKIGLSESQPAVFCEVNGLVVYSDGTIISRIWQGKDYPMPVPTEQFKIPTPAGQCLALFYRRLLVGALDILYVSDPDTVEQMDDRLCRFPLGGRIGMIAPVDDGVYVSTDARIYFLGGHGPHEWSQPGAVVKVADYPAISGTDIILNAGLTGIEGAKGNLALFTTAKGFCFGLNGGNLINTSEWTVHPETSDRGTAIVREENGLAHYLVAMGAAGSPFNVIQLPTTTVDSI